MPHVSRAHIARYIDHTLLAPEATAQDVAALIAEASELGCYSACVSPSQLPVSVPAGLHLAVVCGFPSGAHHSSVKAAEARLAVAQGAHEVDMVINIGAARAGDYPLVERDIAAVREACTGALLKVILETAALSDEAIRRVCGCAENAGADFVKTSTGFHPAGGATTHAVSLMRETVGNRLGVKASGGIRTAADALAMIDAGATRLGCSATRAILAGLA